MFFRTIRVKLVAWYTIILALILVVFSIMLYFFLSRALSESVDKKLLTIANFTADSTARNMNLSQEWNDFLEGFTGYRPAINHIRILDKSGGIDEDGSFPKRLPITAETVRKAQGGKPTYETLTGLDEYPIRVIIYPVMENDKLATLIQVGTSLEYVEVTLKELLFNILLIVPVLLLFSSVGGYLLARAALGPVHEMTTTARKIGAEDLSQRIKVRNPKDDMGRLGETFNEMLERLEKSFSQIRQFSADASHELRTPLTILKGETEWALRTGREPDEYRETLTSNLEEIDHMSMIIEDLLILSRADIEDIPIEMETVKLGTILKDVCEMGKVLADEKKQELNIDVGTLNGLTIMGNELRLRQLFLNLLDNGIKYTREGGRVDVWAQVVSDGPSGESVEVRFIDNGIGIPQDDQKKIFDRFFRVEKDRSRKEGGGGAGRGGTGLGLSISRFIAQAHNGDISVSSSPGIGSTFTVIFPLSSKGD